MNFLKNLLLINKKTENKKELNSPLINPYEEIANLVKEARIEQNLTTQELSLITKIPEQTLKSIENNDIKSRPKYPFIRSILLKIEECLGLKKSTLVKLATREETIKEERQDFIFRKFDLINTWQGSICYFLILLISLFILKRYFVLNVKIIEIQNVEKKIIEK